MDHALFRPEPPELAVSDQATPETGHIFSNLLQRVACDMGSEQLHSRHAELGATPNGESQPMPVQAVWMVGLENDIGGRIVGVWIHGI